MLLVFFYIPPKYHKLSGFWYLQDLYRSSHQKCSVRKGILRNIAKFTGKHLWRSPFLNFMKKETMAQVFYCEFCKIYKKTFFYRTPLVAASGYRQRPEAWNGLRCFETCKSSMNQSFRAYSLIVNKITRSLVYIFK